MMYSCNDSNDTFHMFLTLTCLQLTTVGVSQYVNISQYTGCNISIQENTISLQLQLPSLHINIIMASATRLAEQLVQDYWYVP